MTNSLSISLFKHGEHHARDPQKLLAQEGSEEA